MTKNNRTVKKIVVHCTATPSTTTVASLKRYWKEVRKWGDIPGYHYVILCDGTIVQLQDESKNSFGVYAHNSECINIAYLGGVDKDNKPTDNRTPAQKRVLFNKIVELIEKYKGAVAKGHRDFDGVNKACPCFDVKTWLAEYTPDLDSKI